MSDVIWLGVWGAVTGSGIAIIATRRSWPWIAAGIAYLLGGLGFSVYVVVEHPGDVAVWFATMGFFSLLVASLLTLIAIGRRGRRQFLVIFGAATLTIGMYQFWTTNWVARFGDTATWCAEAGHALAPGTIDRIPPRVQCRDGFALADGISWLALGGWSLFYGFALSFPIMGVAWAARRMPPFYRPDFDTHRVS